MPLFNSLVRIKVLALNLEQSVKTVLMYKNYLLVALRSLQRNLGYSLINIAGLSIGITCSIHILLWVYDEITFNKSFGKYELLHQIKVNNTVDNGTITRSTLPLPLQDVLLKQDSRIKRYAITIHQSALLTVGEKKLNKSGLDVSEDFLTLFDYEMIEGNPQTALNDLHSIVLTQSTAFALFGDEDPVGKTVLVKYEIKLK